MSNFKEHVMNEDKAAIKASLKKKIPVYVGPSESVIQAKGIKKLERDGAYVVKIIKANKAGVHDVLACIPTVITKEMVGSVIGAFHSIEFKTPVGRVSELQKYHMEKVQDAGGISFVARSVDDLRAILD